MQRRALLLSLGALAACGPKPLPPLPPAPRVTAPVDLIPSDLDVVVRLDLGRVKAALGAATVSTLAGEVLARGSAKQAADELLIASLLEADLVYLGYRPSRLGAPLDRVLALQGHFAQLMHPPDGFSGATDLGADVRYWDAKVRPPREGVARIYAFSDRLRAFSTEAEIDALELRLAGGGGARRLEPPAEGTLSFAARPALLARLAGNGILRDLLEGSKSLSAVADLESDGARLKAELVLESPDQATDLVSAGRLVLDKVLGDHASKLELRADAERVLLDARLSRNELLALFAQARGD
ncbi:MAG TPA: hypothetical protein VHB79_11755 [Polyangiaceae bacterium]|nr:hypothetical protein [Polyangiaceae bacterium]